MMTSRFPWLTFLMLISFASVNAVIPTPALPEIGRYFDISNDHVQLLMSLYLIGYAIGQLIYGPIANRYGRKPALYLGIIIQIISNVVCILAGYMHWFAILPIARLCMALGAGVGLKMTFTLINETSDSKTAAKRTAILIIAFAIAPGLGVCISSLFLSRWSWQGCFYFAAGYGLLLLILVSRLPETRQNHDDNALKISHLIRNYQAQFGQKSIYRGGVLIGCASTFIYLFATWSPLITINQHGISETKFALLNLFPTLGMLLGAITSAYLSAIFSTNRAIKLGIQLACSGVLAMVYAHLINLSILFALFLPMAIINFALSLIFANVSTLALQECSDKSNGSAVLHFINMGMTAILVLSIGLLPASPTLLIAGFMGIALIMVLTFKTSNQMITNKIQHSL